jgi:prepilin peptidase CpaA
MLFLPFVCPICVWAAWSDLARMKIPNRAVAALVVVFLLVGPMLVPWPEYAARWLHLLVVLLVGFGLTSAGLIGAGDAKFLAAAALFVDRGDASFILWLTAAVLLVTFASHRAVRACPAIRRRVAHWESWRRREFPVGLALGLTLPLYLAMPFASSVLMLK